MSTTCVLKVKVGKESLSYLFTSSGKPEVKQMEAYLCYVSLFVNNVFIQKLFIKFLLHHRYCGTTEFFPRGSLRQVLDICIYGYLAHYLEVSCYLISIC